MRIDLLTLHAMYTTGSSHMKRQNLTASNVRESSLALILPLYFPGCVVGSSRFDIISSMNQ
jgi:hypothetical protein